ncbi:phosphatase PAP2 family protein [Cohnella cellulosilytica]|uniref:Phosphatase PAP2 family protein n=1 Tax=Cohnella cellulosilytica TaxID=986710 RepID=A0ABW2F6Y6_9BACL
MEEKLYRRPYLWTLLAVLLFIAVSWLVMKDKLASFDSAIIGVVQGWESPGATRTAELFSLIGSTEGVIVIVVATAIFLAFSLGHRKELLLLVFCIGGAPLLNTALKMIFRRERPDLHRLAEELGYSFPSGHSMAAFALYGVLAYLLWRHVPGTKGRFALVSLAALLAFFIGLSRIYLGVHYPSDVLAGYLASTVWLGLGIGLFGAWLRKRD